MAYSEDLREKVVEYVGRGNSAEKAGSTFNIGDRTVYRWLKQKKEQGTLAPKKRESSPRKIDYGKLKDYIEDHPDQFLYEIADHFKVTLQAIFFALKKLKITRKKRPRYIKKGTKN